jgi:serine/threonine protein kinase
LPTEADDTITLTHGDIDPAAAKQVSIPRRLGSVRLTQELGRGGMGVVWLGRDELLGRDVAVKFLLNIVTGSEDPGFVRFIDGARAATAARHPTLTTIYHADTIEGTPYLVMEYVNGASLADIIRASGSLSDSVCLAVLQDVCDGLGELHERHIIHRDIKPGNVLIDFEGRVYLTDFGLSCARPAEGAASSDAVAGTPAYMAPEMFDGAVSERSDVYALGLMTYQMLTGKRAFTGPLAQVRRHHMLSPLPLEPLHKRGVPEEIIGLLERATNKDAVFRYKTARHFHERLVEAFPDIKISLADRRALASLVSRSRGASPEEEAVATTGSGGSSYYDTLARRAAEKRSDPLPPKPREGSSDLLSLEPDSIPISESITFDLHCSHCDYNLRGLNSSSRCPECGEPLSTSLHQSRLVFAPISWIKSLIRGVDLLLIQYATQFLVFIVSGVLGVMEGMRAAKQNATPGGITELKYEQSLIIYGLSGLTLLFLSAGTFFLTRQKPDRFSDPTQSLLMWMTRGFYFAYLFFVLISMSIFNISSTEPYALLFGLVITVTQCLFFTSAFAYLARILARVPAPACTRSLMVVAVIFGLFGLLTLAAGLMTASLTDGVIMTITLASVLIFLLMIVAIVPLWKARKVLVQTRRRHVDITPETAN